jgi:cytochrome oxidase assembly protein ShyY1
MADERSNSQHIPSSSRNRRRKLMAVVLLAMLGSLFISLGNWQLNRAQERRQIAADIEKGRQSAPVRLTTHTDTSILKPWQSAQVSGLWMPAFSLLLDNRNLDGKPGYWLATPLRLSTDKALLVLRGWVARPIGQFNPFPTITQSDRTVSVDGEIARRVPQLYEISDKQALQFDVDAIIDHAKGISAIDLGRLQQLQNVSLEPLSKALGMSFLPVVLMQTNDTDGTDLVRQWPTPSIDADTNIGYAMQWFSFAAIAFGAMGVLLWQVWRREKILPQS